MPRSSGNLDIWRSLFEHGPIRNCDAPRSRYGAEGAPAERPPPLIDPLFETAGKRACARDLAVRNLLHQIKRRRWSVVLDRELRARYDPQERALPPRLQDINLLSRIVGGTSEVASDGLPEVAQFSQDIDWTIILVWREEKYYPGPT